MQRTEMINRVGIQYHTANIEGGEYSYIQAAGSQAELESKLGHTVRHYKLDIRFQSNNVVVLIETKPRASSRDEAQLKCYIENEHVLYPQNKIIAILANIRDDTIKVWRNTVDERNLITNERSLDTMEHYCSLFEPQQSNDREAVLHNTYNLNETLHKKDIDEKLRSQFVGTALLYIRDEIKRQGITTITEESQQILREHWSHISPSQICTGIQDTLSELLDGSEFKQKKIELLQRSVLNNQKVKRLTIEDWVDILNEIVGNIYRYINTDSSEGQDILNLFFIAFNKYVGKADKNQAFTPDHITNFMCRATGVDHTKRLFDGTCGSGSFLVQGMILELFDCNRQRVTKARKEQLQQEVFKNHIFGVEIEEKAYGLATTNMLIHGDGNSNIRFGNLFDNKAFLKQADPDIILMNPPYNAKPKSIPENYKTNWSQKAKNGKADPTKGFVFVKFISDCIKKFNEERLASNQRKKEVKLAVLLPVAVAIGGSSKIIVELKHAILEDNTLEAVFTLPNEIFYPGASASACCMVFTLGKPHVLPDGTIPETFFGYYKEDGHKKKKNLGRVEQYDSSNQSIWKKIEDKWLDLFRNKRIVDGISTMKSVTGDDEWLCEAYMKTDYTTLTEAAFRQTINDYCGYLVRAGKYPSLNYRASIVVPELDVQHWKEFTIKEILKCQTTSMSIKDELSSGPIPFISRSAENNGCDGSVDVTEDKITKGNCITIGAEGVYSFYQPNDFATGNKVYQIRNPHLNVYTAMFLTTILNCEAYRYSYGRARILGKLNNETIKLPVTASGKPDWQFMEDYIKALPYGDRLE